MDLYGWLVAIHIVAWFFFFLSHGAAAAVALRLSRERDLARVRALLELSQSSVGIVFSASFVVAVLAGIWLGFLGGYWGRLWLWGSIVILAVVVAVMTPMAAMPLRRIRAAAGLARGKAGEVPPADEAELQRLLEAWNPWPTVALGVVAIVSITWLMLAKPF